MTPRADKDKPQSVKNGLHLEFRKRNGSTLFKLTPASFIYFFDGIRKIYIIAIVFNQFSQYLTLFV